MCVSCLQPFKGWEVVFVYLKSAVQTCLPFFSFNLNCREEMRVVSGLGASTSVNFIPKSLLDFYVGRNKYLWIISRAFSHITCVVR